jgi:5-methylcytosine-specific restriction endonuclease McrA
MGRRSTKGDAYLVLIALIIGCIYAIVKGISMFFEWLGYCFTSLVNLISRITLDFSSYIINPNNRFEVILSSLIIFSITFITIFLFIVVRKNKIKKEQKVIEAEMKEQARIAEERAYNRARAAERKKQEEKYKMDLLKELQKKQDEEQLRIENENKRKQEEARIKKEELMKEITKIEISDNRDDYIFHKNDYNRGNKTDNYYRKKWFLTILSIYGNKCANCGSNKNGCDLDHFVFSKNEGGNFMLHHKNGYLVNNAIPLCEACNRRKGDKSYKYFFSQEKLLDIFQKNMKVTELLNDKTE